MQHGFLCHQLLVLIIGRRQSSVTDIIEDIVYLFREAQILLSHPVEDNLDLIVKGIVAEQFVHWNQHLPISLFRVVATERRFQRCKVLMYVLRYPVDEEVRRRKEIILRFQMIDCRRNDMLRWVLRRP